MHKATVHIRSSGDVDVHEVEGEVVEVNDPVSATGRALYVSIGGNWLQRLTPDWTASRSESLTRAAQELEQVAARLTAKAVELRSQAEESRPLPASSGTTPATGRAPPVVAT